MRPTVKGLIKLFCGLLALLFYCEYVIYFVVLKHCDWPTLDPSTKDLTITEINEAPVKVMFLADTHLLGSRNGHWYDKLRREWQMYRAFQTALTLHQPELVFILGDITDEGYFCSIDEFQYYIQRFQDLFHVPKSTKIFAVVGNHDIGFHYWITPYLNKRFVEGFNSSAVELVSVRGNHFVLVNSMGLEGDGCFLCKQVERQLSRIEKILKCSNGDYNETLCHENQKLKPYSRPILLQHYPLYRESDIDCTDFDAAPLPIREERFRPTWECLSKDATNQLVYQLRPRLALSGHTHHGCTRKLPTDEGLEITIPSFSWRNKKNPNYALALFTPNNYAFFKCEMPNESNVVLLYIVGVIVLFTWQLISLFRRERRIKHKCG